MSGIVVNCPTCSTRIITTEEEAKETMARATPPGTERVPEGTVELLGKICARFLEIEYQHELNQPHIGDGVMYEMLEDLNSILATRIIDMVREHDGNHIANAGKMVKIGDFTLSNDPPIDGKIWINRKSGEGGSFDLGKFEAHIEAFYQEHL